MTKKNIKKLNKYAEKIAKILLDKDIKDTGIISLNTTNNYDVETGQSIDIDLKVVYRDINE